MINLEEGFALVTEDELVIVKEQHRVKLSDLEIEDLEEEEKPLPEAEKKSKPVPEPEEEEEEEEEEEDDAEEDDAEEDDAEEEWTLEELDELDRDSLIELIDDEELDLDPDDYKSTKKLRAAIAEELEIED